VPPEQHGSSTFWASQPPGAKKDLTIKFHLGGALQIVEDLLADDNQVCYHHDVRPPQ
jgi:hypothetical protein